MLALQYIRENKDTVLKGLEKRGFKSLDLIDKIIDLDQQRRSIQTKLDSHLSDSNQIKHSFSELLSLKMAYIHYHYYPYICTPFEPFELTTLDYLVA